MLIILRVYYPEKPLRKSSEYGGLKKVAFSIKVTIGIEAIPGLENFEI